MTQLETNQSALVPYEASKHLPLVAKWMGLDSLPRPRLIPHVGFVAEDVAFGWITLAVGRPSAMLSILANPGHTSARVTTGVAALLPALLDEARRSGVEQLFGFLEPGMPIQAFAAAGFITDGQTYRQVMRLFMSAS